MRKPLKTAAWAGAISLIISIISLPFIFLIQDPAINVSVSILISIIGFVCGILFLNGFLVLGKKFKSMLLIVMSWIGIALAILMLLFSLIGGIITLATNVSAQELDSNSSLTNEETIAAILFLFLILWIPISIFFGAYSILFGIGMLKLKDKIKYAKPAGILNIVAGATYIVLIGFFVRIAAYIFEIMMFFSASKKYEK